LGVGWELPAHAGPIPQDHLLSVSWFKLARRVPADKKKHPPINRGESFSFAVPPWFSRRSDPSFTLYAGWRPRLTEFTKHPFHRDGSKASSTFPVPACSNRRLSATGNKPTTPLQRLSIELRLFKPDRPGKCQDLSYQRPRNSVDFKADKTTFQ